MVVFPQLLQSSKLEHPKGVAAKKPKSQKAKKQISKKAKRQKAKRQKSKKAKKKNVCVPVQFQRFNNQQQLDLEKFQDVKCRNHFHFHVS